MIQTATAAGTVTISGPEVIGQTLRADTSGIPQDETTTYKWKRGDDLISNAAGQSYRLTADDEGKQITVEVTYTLPGALEPTTAVSAGTKDPIIGKDIVFQGDGLA